MGNAILFFWNTVGCISDNHQIRIKFKEEATSPLRLTFSSMGTTKSYELVKNDRIWQTPINQPIGSFAHISLHEDNQQLYSGPISMSNQFQKQINLKYTNSHGLEAIGQPSPFFQVQYLWGLLLVVVFLSLLRKGE